MIIFIYWKKYTGIYVCPDFVGAISYVLHSPRELLRQLEVANHEFLHYFKSKYSNTTNKDNPFPISFLVVP